MKLFSVIGFASLAMWAMKCAVAFGLRSDSFGLRSDSFGLFRTPFGLLFGLFRTIFGLFRTPFGRLRTLSDLTISAHPMAGDLGGLVNRGLSL